MRFPAVIWTAFVSALVSATVMLAADRPNILFIMTDDHAAHAISAYGSRINRTPNLDRLASQGLRMDRCFAGNSICTPSRATLLTGQYSHRNGVPVFNDLDPSKTTVAHRMQQAGYYTAMLGKWHLGSDPQGFDDWNILPGQGRYNDPVFYDRSGHRIYKGYVTEIITELTVGLLKNRPKDKPFFLMCHHKAPHREWTPSEKYRREFAGREFPEPPTFRDTYERPRARLARRRPRPLEVQPLLAGLPRLCSERRR
jgi:arylsulfatase A-like enzyme